LPLSSPDSNIFLSLDYRLQDVPLTPIQFVQSLSSPFYINHLAVHKYFEQPGFVEYLRYLQYWAHPPYLKYLQYPGPTLKHLELLQQEKFRTEILDVGLTARLAAEGWKASVEWPGKE
jgi:mediator of RNA polymerase II transcription subunit 31